MSGFLKIGLILALILLVLGFAAFQMFGVPGVIGFALLLGLSVFGLKKLAGAALESLAMKLFGAKGSALKGSKVRVHQITETSGPVRRVSISGTSNGGDDDEDSVRQENQRYFIVEVTITPPGESPPFRSWEPESLLLVPAATTRGDLTKMDDSLQGHVESYDLWDGTRFLHDDEGGKLEGEQRVRLLFSVPKHLAKVKFAYYFECFGNLELPESTGEPLAAPPAAPPVSVNRGEISPDAIPIEIEVERMVNSSAAKNIGKITSRLREESESGGDSEDVPAYKISAAKAEGEEHLPDPPGQLRPEDLVTPLKVGASNVKKLTQALNLTQPEAIPQGGQANVSAALAQKVEDQKKDTSHLKWLSATAKQLEDEEEAAKAQPQASIAPAGSAAPAKPRMTTRTIIPPAPKVASSVVAAAARAATQTAPAPMPMPGGAAAAPAPAAPPESLGAAPILPGVPEPRRTPSPVGTVSLPEPPGGNLGTVPSSDASRPRSTPKPGVIQAVTPGAIAPAAASASTEKTAAEAPAQPAGAYGLPKLSVEDRPLPMPVPKPEAAPAAEIAEPAAPEPEPVVEPAPEEAPVLFQEAVPEPAAPVNTFPGPDIDMAELEAAAATDAGEFVLPPGAKVSAEEMRAPAYYLVINGPPEGPYSLENLFTRLADGTLQLTDFTWKEGMPEWVPIENILSEITA